MTDERELDDVLHRFVGLTSAAIDSSSLIYMERAGFLGKLAKAIALVTIPGVIGETGIHIEQLSVIEQPHIQGAVDDQILECAVLRHIPLISEDRKLLLKADRKGMEYYNSLMMHAFLLYRRVIDPDEARMHLSELCEAARYGHYVYRFASNSKFGAQGWERQRGV